MRRAAARTPQRAPRCKARTSLKGDYLTAPPPTSGVNRNTSSLRRKEERGNELRGQRLAAVNGKPGIRPVLLASGVDGDVLVAELRQAVRGDMRILAAAARAVDDDLGGLVRQHLGRERVHVVVREVSGAGQVPVAPVLFRQGLDEHRRGDAGELPAQLFTFDLLQHGSLLEGWHRRWLQMQRYVATRSLQMQLHLAIMRL